jgi:hypothetical protein
MVDVDDPFRNATSAHVIATFPKFYNISIYGTYKKVPSHSLIPHTFPVDVFWVVMLCSVVVGYHTRHCSNKSKSFPLEKFHGSSLPGKKQ